MLKKPDYILSGAITALVILGTLTLASVSAAFSQEKLGSPYSLLFHQMIYGLFPGLVLGFIAFRIPLAFIKKWALACIVGTVFFLILVFAPIVGISMGGASRWLNLGFFSFQPSEILKLAFILYLAAWLSREGKNFSKSNIAKRLGKRNDLSRQFLPFVIIVGVISLLLVLQPDISTLGIIGLTAVSMYFTAFTPLWQTFAIVLAGFSGLVVLVKLAPYRLQRLLVFLNPETEPMGIGYHIKQALIAIGSGGIFGVGLGMSRQKFGFLPESIGDSVFAIFAEETGFIGVLFLISLFLAFAWRGLKVAKEAKDEFSRLLAVGITFWIILQALINIGSMVAILPLSGIPLPFFSYGGTALAMELAAMGILLNISKTT